MKYHITYTIDTGLPASRVTAIAFSKNIIAQFKKAFESPSLDASLTEFQTDRYQITAVNPDEDEFLGNVVDVYDKFIAYSPDPATMDGYKVAMAIKDITGMDVVVVPRDAELRVLRVLKPGVRM